MTTNKLPKIRGFQNVYKEMHDHPAKVFTWVSKIKVHGTNAAIRFSDGEIIAQKRSDDISVGDDNAGFAAWVEKNKTFLEELVPDFLRNAPEDFTICGEWAGPGIQSGVAVSQIPRKTFFVFALILGNAGDKNQVMIFAESLIRKTLNPINFPEDFIILPEAGLHEVAIKARLDVEQFIAGINTIVEKIEEEDPIIKYFFDITGVGEGLVFFPVTRPDGCCYKFEFEKYAFKVKGEKHSVNKAGKPARIKSDIPVDVYEFIDQHLTEARLEQGLENVPLEMEKTGDFIRWVLADIREEAKLELEEAKHLDWKTQISGPLAVAAKTWFHDKMKEDLEC